MPAPAIAETRDTPEQLRLYQAISACVRMEQISIPGGGYPRLEFYGKAVMVDYLECIGWTVDVDAPAHSSDEQLIQVLRILLRPDQNLTIEQFLQRLNNALIDPSEAMRATALCQTLSQPATIKKIAAVLDAHNISLPRLHCVLGVWMILRGIHLKIVGVDSGGDGFQFFLAQSSV